ncbi:TRAP-type mannitol/chloroaromatic compound transport system, small permease component [Celeribacter neptunius]|uniref:TRAP transporter small permease protein n=2 Tax=Celeribacter neptunius TaxID=588602 RepID=A0A1I3S8C4_9RHOB|nr:TRAP-type mannitol/chloroaromatic compound transport system, small permease component [Celeribacter neptunius]
MGPDMSRILSFARALLSLPGKIVAWLIIPLILSIVLSVIAARFGWSTLLDWDGSIPLFGEALTVNSLVDLQWYIFSLIVLFGGVWAYFDERHVTVDFIALSLKPRTRAYITLFGDLFLLLPLCILVIRYGSDFAAIAWRTGEGSNQGGLAAHWLIKGALPTAFGLLGLAALTNALRTLCELRKGTFHETEIHHDS